MPIQLLTIFVAAGLIAAYFTIRILDRKDERKRRADQLRELTRHKLAHAHKLNIETRWSD